MKNIVMSNKIELGQKMKGDETQRMNKITVVNEPFAYAPEYESNISNLFVRGRYSASLLENQIFKLSLALCKDEKDNRLRATISKSHLMKLTKSENTHDFYKLIKLAAYRLLRIHFFTEDEKQGKFKLSSIVTDIEWDDGAGEFSIIFNETFRDPILNAKANYTTLNLECLCKLKTIGACRLYEILRSYCFYGKHHKGEKNGRFEITFGVSELKCILNLIDLSREEFAQFFTETIRPDYDAVLDFAYKLHDEDVKKDKPKKDTYPKPKYNAFHDFSRYVIEPACKEISQKTEIDVSFEPIPKSVGGKIKYITFHIQDKTYLSELPKKDDEKENEEKDIYTLIDQVRDIIAEKISTQEIVILLQDANNDVEKIKKMYNLIIGQGGKINNLVGMLRVAIREDWKETISKAKKDSFNNFTQRKYDFDAIEQEFVYGNSTDPTWHTENS